MIEVLLGELIQKKPAKEYVKYVPVKPVIQKISGLSLGAYAEDI